MPVSKARPAAKKATAGAKKDRTTQGYTLGSKKRAGEVLVDLLLPSGETCEARRPGVQGFIAAGVLDSFDSLTGLVQAEHIAKKSARPQKVTKEEAREAGLAMMQDASKMTAAFRMIDKLVAYAVTQPTVWIGYQMDNESDEDWAKRQEENTAVVDVQDVDLADKLFIMQWAVGGSADLAAFRKEFGSSLDDLEAMQAVSLQAE